MAQLTGSLAPLWEPGSLSRLPAAALAQPWLSAGIWGEHQQMEARSLALSKKQNEATAPNPKSSLLKKIHLSGGKQSSSGRAPLRDGIFSFLLDPAV